MLLTFLPVSVVANTKVVNLEEEVDALITPGATSTILMEATTGKILYNKDANKPLAVASLTKMMSLIIVFETMEKGGLTYDEIITVSATAKEMGGTQLWLETGEKISVRDLLKGITMASANDAMVAMAERVAGKEEAFVIMMNRKAKELGLKNTNFKNSTGLDEKDHYSSAYDMAIIAKELLTHEEVLKFTSVYESYIRENTNNKTWLSNTNKLVRFYEGADGLKTGFTDAAKSCIAATAKKDNLRLIAINLGYSNLNTRNKETMELLDYGYNQFKAKFLYKKGDIVGSVIIDKAETKKINLIISEDVTMISRKIDPDKNYKIEIQNKDIIYPIKKGDSIGILIIKDGNETVRRVDLVAEKDIKQMGIIRLYFSLFKDILVGF